MDGRKFSFSIRVDKINPVHIHLSVFAAMILQEYEHNEATREKAGELTLRADEFAPFLDQVQPHMVTAALSVPVELIERYTGIQLDISAATD
jgi:hypothetical protein